MAHKSLSTIDHQQKLFKLQHSSFIIPIVALAGLGTLSILAVNQDTSYDASALSLSGPIGVTTEDTDYSITITKGDNLTIDADTTTDGVYASTKDTITVTTNNPTGYNLYLSSASPDPKLFRDGDSSTYIDSTDGTYTEPATLTMNTYGYAVPTTAAGAVNTNFNSSYATPNPAPGSVWAALKSSNNPTADRIQTFDTADTNGRTIDVYYAARVNNALTAGSYTGAVLYTAIAQSYTPEIDPSASAAINPTKVAQDIAQPVTIVTTLNTVATIDPSDITVTFTNTSNSSITGTCTNITTSTSTGRLTIGCTAPALSTLGAYTVTATVSSYGKTYTITGGYTVTAPTLKQAADVAGITTMQGLTRAVCGKAGIYEAGETDLTLKDSRDNNTYMIRKLADGNCWMVQNLRLTRDTLTAAGNTTGTLTPNDTNITTNTTLPAVNEAFCATDDEACIKILNHMNSGNTEYGAYYSWAAATLDSTVYSKGRGDVAETSVCPKSGSGNTFANSWHIPTGTNSGEWYNMMTKYNDGITNFDGSVNARKDFTDATITGTTNTYGSNYAPNLPFSGAQYDSRTINQGSGGGFWSSTARDSTSAYSAYVNRYGRAYAGTDGDSKRNGYSVRCVLTSS